MTVGNVTLTEAPTAVVSLSPATTEMVYDLGYGELLVGVSEYCTARRQLSPNPGWAAPTSRRWKK